MFAWCRVWQWARDAGFWLSLKNILVNCNGLLVLLWQSWPPYVHSCSEAVTHSQLLAYPVSPSIAMLQDQSLSFLAILPRNTWEILSKPGLGAGPSHKPAAFGCLWEGKTLLPSCIAEPMSGAMPLSGEKCCHLRESWDWHVILAVYSSLPGTCLIILSKQSSHRRKFSSWWGGRLFIYNICTQEGQKGVVVGINLNLLPQDEDHDLLTHPYISQGLAGIPFLSREESTTEPH